MMSPFVSVASHLDVILDVIVLAHFLQPSDRPLRRQRGRMAGRAEVSDNKLSPPPATHTHADNTDEKDLLTPLGSFLEIILIKATAFLTP